MNAPRLSGGQGFSVGIAIGLCFAGAISASLGLVGIVFGLAMGAGIGVMLQRRAG